MSPHRYNYPQGPWKKSSTKNFVEKVSVSKMSLPIFLHHENHIAYTNTLPITIPYLNILPNYTLFYYIEPNYTPSWIIEPNCTLS